MKNIVIKGAREHNLKNVNVTLPRDKFIVITGLSGSGKSTLAFDTLYAEGQRRYVESLSAYARQFLGLMNKPDVDTIEGLSPAISIEQKTTSKNPRSTVGTVTEIYDYFRLLFARVGDPYCPKHGIKIVKQSPQKIAEKVAKDFAGNVIVLAPIVRQKKGTYEKLFKDLNKDGFTRARVNGEIKRTDEKIVLERYKKHDIEVVIDRVSVRDGSRLAEAVENALKKAKGLVVVVDAENGRTGLQVRSSAKQEDRATSPLQHNKRKTLRTGPEARSSAVNSERIYSSDMACPECGFSFEELQPRMFSFNSPFGACETCHGLGIKMEFDPDLIIPDKNKAIIDGAIQLYRNAVDGWRGQYLASVAKHFGFDVFTPIGNLTDEQMNILLYGSDEKIKFQMTMKGGEASWSNTGNWEGLIPQSDRLYQQTNSDYRRRELEKFMRISKCPVCDGKRLNEKALSVLVNKKSIIKVTDLSIKDCLKFFEGLKFSEKKMTIAKQLLKEIKARLQFLDQVGLSYLTLSRSAGTLSGGEAQRIRLATQIGSNLMGVLYILDEPSIGLHQRDNQKLINTLHHLRDIGNTLIVVEHDEDTIRKADYVVDIGPGAGIHGGKITAIGTPKQIEKSKKSLTGEYLSGKRSIATPEKRRKPNGFITLKKCEENNLKKVTAKIPTGVLTLVTGVSGSGKSTLIYEILYKAMMQEVYGSRKRPGKHEAVEFEKDEIDKVIVIDQSPIGKTPRSNPATYTKVFDEVRKLFRETKEAKIRGYQPGRFSFNVKGGRCEACQGDGVIKIEMNFLPDVFVKCEECKGLRYNKETLEVKYKGKSIADVLAMSIEEAGELFKNVSTIKNKLDVLERVGLGYIKLGQRSTTLSGGEAQRIKLTRELAKRGTGKTLYLLDEPTTGLHFHDVKKLIAVLNDLVDKDNSVVVIEHNLDLIKSADQIIDLGPEGGDQGGQIVATGTPEEVAKNKNSRTGEFLREIL